MKVQKLSWKIAAVALAAFAVQGTFAALSNAENFGSPGLRGVEEGPSNAHLDRARELSKFRLKNEICENDAYVSAVLGELKAAIDQDPTVVAQVKTQIVNQPIRKAMGNNLYYKKLLGDFDSANLTRPSLRAGLVGTKFYSTGSGAYGSLYKVEFKANGKARIERLKVLNEEPWTRTVVLRGTYAVVGQGSSLRVVLKFGTRTLRYSLQEDPYAESYEFILRDDGVPADEYPVNGRILLGSPSECEA